MLYDKIIEELVHAGVEYKQSPVMRYDGVNTLDVVLKNAEATIEYLDNNGGFCKIPQRELKEISTRIVKGDIYYHFYIGYGCLKLKPENIIDLTVYEVV